MQKAHNSKDPTKDTFEALVFLSGMVILVGHILYSGLLTEKIGEYEELIKSYLPQSIVYLLKALYPIFLVLYLKTEPFIGKHNVVKKIGKRSLNYHKQSLIVFCIAIILTLLIPVSWTISVFIVGTSMSYIYIYRDVPLSLAFIFPNSKQDILKTFSATFQGNSTGDDGYETIQQRENRLNGPIIGHNNDGIFFAHKFHRCIDAVLNGNPRRGNIIIGGSGSGKTDSFLNPMAWQTMEQGVPMFGYDFKGPVQTRVMIKKYLELHKAGKTKMFFHYNTFAEESSHIIWRLNPICSKTIVTDYHADVYMQTFMSCLKKKWIRDPDFWAESMFAYGSAVILAHKKYLPKFTFAHVINFLSQDYEKQIRALINLEDDQISAKIENIKKPVLEGKGADQLSGIFSTIQNFMSRLHNAPLFFAISGDESTLDLNDPENPGFLWVGNDNFYRKAFQPIISMYASIIFNVTNKEGKLPFHFMADEAATLFLPGVEDYINTGRSNGMITTLAIQSLAQNVFEYGTELARVIQGSLSNVVFGQTNDPQTQEAFSKLLGTYKMGQTNQSHSTGSNKSVTINTSQTVEHYLRPDEIGTLPKGYFAGKMSEGENQKFMGPVDITDYLKDFEAAKHIKMPLGPTVSKLYTDGDISQDQIHNYYRGSKKAETVINKEVIKYAQSEYQRIIRESNLFLMNASIAESKF